MANYVYVPQLDSRPIYDGSVLSKQMQSQPYGEDQRTDNYTWYNPGLGANGQATLDLLKQASAKMGKPDFDWTPYVNKAYQSNIMNWTAGGGNKTSYSGWISPQMVYNSIVSQAAQSDPSWSKALYASAELATATKTYQDQKQAGSTGGGVFGQIMGGVANIAKALAPAALVTMGIPALLSGGADWGLGSAIAANASGAGAAAAAENAFTGMSVPGAGLPSAAGEVAGGASATAPLATDAATAAPSLAESTAGVSTSAPSFLSGSGAGAAEDAFTGMSVPGAGIAPATTSSGLIDQILGWANKNPALASGALQLGGGILKGIGDSANLDTTIQAKKDLLDQQYADELKLLQDKQKMIQQGSYYDAKVPFNSPAQARAVTRPGGSAVYNNQGLIATAMH